MIGKNSTFLYLNYLDVCETCYNLEYSNIHILPKNLFICIIKTYICYIICDGHLLLYQNMHCNPFKKLLVAVILFAVCIAMFHLYNAASLPQQALLDSYFQHLVPRPLLLKFCNLHLLPPV